MKGIDAMPKATYKIPQLCNFIDGAFEASEGRGVSLVNPSDQSRLGEQQGSSPAALERALAAAARCHRRSDWYSLGARRAIYLLAIADAVEQHRDEFAYLDALNTGVVITQTQFLSRLLPFIFRGVAQQLLEHPDCQPINERIEQWHKPWGPAVCLAPWNSPSPIGSHKLAAALAAGAPVILKASEWTPYSAQRLFELIASCDLPAGAVQLVHGAAAEGAQLVADPRVKAVSFTGGYRGGQAVAAACLPQLKPLQLELGGHNPFIVLPDADENQVGRGLLEGMTRLNGQWCRAIGRIFLPRARAEAITGDLLERLARLKIGSALDATSELGPLIHHQHKNHIEHVLLDLEARGARVQRAHRLEDIPQEGAYFGPTLVSSLSPNEDREEIFGPVAVVHSYDHLDEVEDWVQASPYGLAAYVYGRDEASCYSLARRLEVGSTKINGVSITSLSPKAPRSAWGISGLGEEGDFESFRFFQGSTLIGTLNS